MDISTVLKEIMPIRDTELLSIIEAASHIETYSPGDSIKHQGEEELNIRFLISGVIRGFMVNAEGRETTVCFITKPGEIIYGSGSISIQTRASEIEFLVLKESEVFAVPIRLLLVLRERFREISNIYIDILTKSVDYHWKTKKMLYMKSAQERYQWFLKEYPGLIDQVNHKSIASFLNITPVTLSRIRHGTEENRETLNHRQ